MKLLITGFAGFVSAHFLELLNRIEPGSEVMGIDKLPPSIDTSLYPNLKIDFQDIDLLDRPVIAEPLHPFALNLFCTWHQLVPSHKAGKHH